MNVGELIKELESYDPNLEVRIVNRSEGWDDPIFMVVPDTYGLSDAQMGICIN